MRKLIRHAAAFIGSFAVALTAITGYWILRDVLGSRLPNPVREILLRSVLTYPLRQGIIAAAGAALAFIPMRARLRALNVITISRTSIIGALAGVLLPISMTSMFWLSRNADLPRGPKTTLAFSLACGAVSTVALYFPWWSVRAEESPANSENDSALLLGEGEIAFSTPGAVPVATPSSSRHA
jgi:predicted membrane-bound spermidine synthase